MIRPGGAFATVSEMAPFLDVACGKGRMPLCAASARESENRGLAAGESRRRAFYAGLEFLAFDLLDGDFRPPLPISPMSLPGATPVSSIICSIHASVRGERV